jgi:hypothetical protein
VIYTVFQLHGYFLSVENTEKEVVVLLLKFAVKDFLEDRDLKNVTAKTLKGYIHTGGTCGKMKNMLII